MGWFVLPCFLQLLLSLFPSYSYSMVPTCHHDDATALLQFNKSFHLSSPFFDSCTLLGQASFPKTASWANGTNCCMWDGVTCDTISGHVIGLDLSCSWLYGKLHPNSTLFQLTHLQTLNLAFNDFLDSPMASEFGSLVSLTHLNLSHSGFKGVIPSKISHISKLVSLDLSSNYLLSFEPSTWEELILNVSALRDLAIDEVDMSFIKAGSLSLLMNFSSSLVSLSLRGTNLHGNWTTSILCLPNLQKLDLSWNFKLNGPVPRCNWSSPLKYLDLSGSIFSGKLSDSIGRLKSLNHLDLQGCEMDGPIPKYLWNLTQLTFLSLRSNRFGGEIPSSITNLQHLTSLDLSYCNFDGVIPPLWNLTQLVSLRLVSNNISGKIPPSLSKLQNLVSLDLLGNNLSGPIPDVFSNLSKLGYLSLSYNNLEGQLPLSLFDLTQLFELDCQSNKLVGKIPNKIGQLSNLDHIDLFDNRLHGNIPKSIFDLKNLYYLSLSSNDMTIFINFYQFSKLKYLNVLDLSQNNFVSLSLETNFGYTFPNLGGIFLSSCNINSFPKFLVHLQNLDSLDLSHNKIHGRIPNWFNEHLSLSWKLIKFVDLSSNMLQGDLPIPSNNTHFFSVSKNKLTGGISSSICNATSLEILNLSHNNFTGTIPECLGTLPSLFVLDLKMNNFSGVIPRNFSKAYPLLTLNLNGNQLEGTLPRSLAHCKQLEVLDIGENNIEDKFPSWLEPLQELQVLVLRANKFHGDITNLKTKDTFPKLRIFDVSNNYFSGPLPTPYIKNFKGMMNLNNPPTSLLYMERNFIPSNQYNDSVVLTLKGNYMELERILTAFIIIDFSNNKFDGKIPEVIGELDSLIGLNISYNRIHGKIPQSLGDLKSLEWLDLSSNKLTGNIPLALTKLNYLSVLNLSENRLEGMIPSGGQFNTFQNDSYEGNLGLCGFPVSKSCNDDEEQRPDSTTFHREGQFEFGWKPVAVGYACGAVVGVLLGYIVFTIGKPQWLVRLIEGVPQKRM